MQVGGPWMGRHGAGDENEWEELSMAIPERDYEVRTSAASRRSVQPRTRFNTHLADVSLTGKRGRIKQPPPEVTHAENFYYLKQMNLKTPMVIVMNDGEQVHGCIEWYDKSCLKVNREGAPNLVIQKHCIKYLFKQSDLNGEE